MAETANHRTLAATPRKIERARREGQVARSRELSHFLGLGIGLAALGLMAPRLTAWLGVQLVRSLQFDARLLAEPGAMLERLAGQALAMMIVLLPVAGLAVVLAFAAALLSGGWNFTFAPLAPNWQKLSPLQGLKRLVSGAHLADAAKASALALALVALGGWLVHGQWLRFVELVAMPLPRALASAGALLQEVLLVLAALLALFALIDVPLQRELLARRLRMSVEELKREMRESEGNTEVKGKMRVRMRQMAGRRMLAAVPRADLVVMNPTHYAVALKYDEARMAAPRVVAKGADLLALRIRDLAREAQVPVLQAPPLARALYAHTDVDQEIPARLFGAVAQVLAWVYQLRDALAAGRAFTADAPEPQVPADMDPLAGAPAEHGGAGA
jgi:flagellar biosynthetic protein FlhB